MQPRTPAFVASPWLAAGLAVLVVALVAGVILVSNPFPFAASPTPTAPSCPPACSIGPSVAPTPTGEPSFVRPTPSPEPTFTSYVVQRGDTLTSIAERFRTTARSIAWWNRGAYPSLDPESPTYDPNHIQPGWILVVLPGIVVDEANPPSPSPAPPTPSPAASVAPSVAPTSQPSAAAPAATVISHGTRGTTTVALTFDMGGRLDPAVQIVQWLIDHGVHATLFPTGASGSTTTQGRAALTLAAAHPELFDIGNHSWSHPNFTTLTAAQIKDQLTSTEAAIAPIVGQTTKPWFRPPYGAWNAGVRAAVGAAGWRYLVMWDVDAIDWKPVADGGPTTADIVTKIGTNAQGGSIVLMHLGGYNTLDALPGILAKLQAKGLQPVTLGQMFGS